MYKGILKHLELKQALSPEQIQFFFDNTVKGKLSQVQQAAILSAINTKGIHAKELSSFCHILQENMQASLKLKDAIDICGTGGSGLKRINTSTISAFILSALGVTVAKHGNKAASGRFGSFDLLEAMDIKIDLKAEEVERLASHTNLGFLYARSFHPIMKHFAPVRKAIGVPTLFNLIGPLLNPAGTQIQIIGTTFKDKMETIALAAKTLKKKNVMVVSGEDGLDEVTLTGKTFVVELKDGKIKHSSLKPSQFGVKTCKFEEIAGGTAKQNTQIALDILKGECQTRHLDLVLVNAALALKLVGKVSSLKKGYQLAKACVSDGRAYQQYLRYKMNSQAPSVLLDIAQHKKQEVESRKHKLPLKRFQKKLKASQRDFKAGLLRQGISLIAEIKKASPSAGLIKKGRFDVTKIAADYEEAGARAISVLTDQKYFSGSLENLQKAKKASSLPLLCKDFIIDPYQIYEARKYSADAILLIAALLTTDQIQEMIDIAASLNMNVLLEVHNEEELKRALETNAQIIGINNRNLHNFKIDFKTSQKLAKRINGRVVVVESGIATKADIDQLPKNVAAILIGTSIMKSKDPKKKITSLIGKPKPILKICGVQSVKEALLCQKLGVDYIGLNFVPTSTRRISLQMAKAIVSALKKNTVSLTQVVGVFQDQEMKEVNTYAKQLDLDLVQLSGKETLSQIKQSLLPVIKGMTIASKSDINKAQKMSQYVDRILLDGRHPGSGIMFDHTLLRSLKIPFILAGGLNAINLPDILDLYQPAGIDLASGVEKNGKRDLKQIEKISKIVLS
jgi:indole-3-glycerol phosphate synthase/phosphoribosylanthranilate isomerase